MTWPIYVVPNPIQQALSSESPQPSSQIPTHPQGLLPSRAVAPPPLSLAKSCRWHQEYGAGNPELWVLVPAPIIPTSLTLSIQVSPFPSPIPNTSSVKCQHCFSSISKGPSSPCTLTGSKGQPQISGDLKGDRRTVLVENKEVCCRVHRNAGP